MDKTKRIDFKDAVKLIISGKYLDRVNQILVRPDSPKWLIYLGYNNYPMLMTKNHIESDLGISKKKGFYNHFVSKDVLCNLPNLLDNPIAVYKRKDGNLSVLLKASDKNGNIILCAIKPNSIRNYNNVEIDTNFILSVFGKEHIISTFEHKFSNEELLYPKNVNKKQVISQTLKNQFLDNKGSPDIDNITSKKRTVK